MRGSPAPFLERPSLRRTRLPRWWVGASGWHVDGACDGDWAVSRAPRAGSLQRQRGRVGAPLYLQGGSAGVRLGVGAAGAFSPRSAWRPPSPRLAPCGSMCAACSVARFPRGMGSTWNTKRHMGRYAVPVRQPGHRGFVPLAGWLSTHQVTSSSVPRSGPVPPLGCTRRAGRINLGVPECSVPRGTRGASLRVSQRSAEPSSPEGNPAFRPEGRLTEREGASRMSAEHSGIFHEACERRWRTAGPRSRCTRGPAGGLRLPMRPCGGSACLRLPPGQDKGARPEAGSGADSACRFGVRWSKPALVTGCGVLLFDWALSGARIRAWPRTGAALGRLRTPVGGGRGGCVAGAVLEAPVRLPCAARVRKGAEGFRSTWNVHPTPPR